jgi:DNA-binding MarR family transcriptional regulator
MKEEKIKEAFFKIKQDMDNLGNQLNDLKQEIFQINGFMQQVNDEIMQLKLENYQKISKNLVSNTSTHNSTHLKKTSTHPATPTLPQEIEGLKEQNLIISTGNEGVSTDRQTNRQTVRQTGFNQNNIQKPIQTQISEASEILDSLDHIKKDIRNKFKKITSQEMLVFSTIYQLEEQDPEGADYKKLAKKLNLSQSSIRDYVNRLIIKGIPIIKQKLNNKKIILHISPELKKIATLDKLIELREIKGFKT